MNSPIPIFPGQFSARVNQCMCAALLPAGCSCLQRCLVTALGMCPASPPLAAPPACHAHFLQPLPFSLLWSSDFRTWLSVLVHFCIYIGPNWLDTFWTGWPRSFEQTILSKVLLFPLTMWFDLFYFLFFLVKLSIGTTSWKSEDAKQTFHKDSPRSREFEDHCEGHHCSLLFIPNCLHSLILCIPAQRDWGKCMRSIAELWCG